MVLAGVLVMAASVGGSQLSRIISVDRILLANLCQLAHSLLFPKSATHKPKRIGATSRALTRN
jgi:hypothetical protein